MSGDVYFTISFRFLLMKLFTNYREKLNKNILQNSYFAKYELKRNEDVKYSSRIQTDQEFYLNNEYDTENYSTPK